MEQFVIPNKLEVGAWRCFFDDGYVTRTLTMAWSLPPDGRDGVDCKSGCFD